MAIVKHYELDGLGENLSGTMHDGGGAG
jgi:hypothetical protein